MYEHDDSDSENFLLDSLGLGLTPVQRAKQRFLALLRKAGDAAEIDMAGREYGLALPASNVDAPLVELFEDATRTHAPLPKLHLLLHMYYRFGIGVEENPDEALRHLNAALETGDNEARMRMGQFLVGEEHTLVGLPLDYERGDILLRAAEKNTADRMASILALQALARYYARVSTIEDAGAGRIALVERYAKDYHRFERVDFLRISAFFAGKSKDYSGPAWQRSRELLTYGAQSFDPEIKKACEARLRLSGLLPPPNPPRKPVSAAPAPRPVTQREPITAAKVVGAAKVAGAVGGMGVILFVWSMIGAALMAFAAMVNAIMISVILVVVAIGGLMGLVRRK